jgi:hypothetical protein
VTAGAKDSSLASYRSFTSPIIEEDVSFLSSRGWAEMIKKVPSTLSFLWFSC